MICLFTKITEKVTFPNKIAHYIPNCISISLGFIKKIFSTSGNAFDVQNISAQQQIELRFVNKKNLHTFQTDTAPCFQNESEEKFYKKFLE